MIPSLLAVYRFTRTEVCVMWAHVEAGIELTIAPADRDGRVEVGVDVWHACDPFGDHQEWVWRASLTLCAHVHAGAAAGEVQIVPDDRTVVASLTFDATKAEQDTAWGIDDASSDRLTPPHDFWSPLFAWGWAQQVPAWSRPLTRSDLEAVVEKQRELPRVDQRLTDALRFWGNGTFSARRGLAYHLEAGAHCEKRDVPGRGTVIVFAAFSPARIQELLAAGPPPDATSEERDDWYRHRAGRRPEYALGWLADGAEADRWVAYLDGEIRIVSP